MEGRFEKELFDKILDKEDLNLNELQFLERCIYLSKTYNELLSIQLGLSPNNLGLKYVHNEALQVAKGLSNESLREKNQALRERLFEAESIIFDLAVALKNMAPRTMPSPEEIERAEKFLEEKE